MFSKEYMSYLLNSKKILIVFISLIFMLLGIVSNSYVAHIINYLFAALLCFVLPGLMFMHVHDKRAVDTYYSLPLRREAILVTSVVFMLAVIYVPYMLSTVISILKHFDYLFDIRVVLPMVGFLALILINSCLFLLANNIFDGAVIVMAYQVFPLIVYMAFIAIGSVFVAGFSEYSISFIQYLSPVMNAAILAYDFAEGKLIVSLVISLIAIAVFSAILYRSYVLRKAERAGTSSTYPLAYPTVISIYTFMIILGFTSNLFQYKDLISAISENIIFYIVIFAIYVSAHFVYRRQFYFDYKMLIFFIASVILSVLICTVLDTTNAFNAAYRQKINKDANYYIYNYYEDEIQDPELKELFDSIYLSDDDGYMITNVRFDDIYTGIDENSLAIIDEYRIKLIDSFNAKRKNKYYYGQCSLNIYNYSDLFDSTSYYYHGSVQLTYKQLLGLAKNPQIKVTFETPERIYRLMPDGDLIISEDFSANPETAE